MTAGKGIEHNEFHSTEFAKKGGMFEMCQLWVNLPKKHKLTQPRYQEILSKQVAVSPLIKYTEGESGEPADISEGSVRVIAGEFNGAKGPAKTFSPIDLWDVVIKPGAGHKYRFDMGVGSNVMIFCRRGRFVCQGQTVGPQDVAMLGLDGSTVVIEALEANTQILFMAGQPLNESIAARGPFVMNTE